MAITNAEIILMEQARLYEEGLIELDEDGMFEPLYTMAVWNKMGYMIIRGQHPITKLIISKHKDKKHENEDNNLQSSKEPEFRRVYTNFFIRRQVRPMTEEELRRRNEKKRR